MDQTSRGRDDDESLIGTLLISKVLQPGESGEAVALRIEGLGILRFEEREVREDSSLHPVRANDFGCEELDFFSLPFGQLVTRGEEEGDGGRFPCNKLAAGCGSRGFIDAGEEAVYSVPRNCGRLHKNST